MPVAISSQIVTSGQDCPVSSCGMTLPRYPNVCHPPAPGPLRQVLGTPLNLQQAKVSREGSLWRNHLHKLTSLLAVWGTDLQESISCSQAGGA
jgi:hypothetical protein